ncbi:uncharacterized protein DNG_08956 [Cephalotrichum gorgonifer]|uniref:NYN domain-containing protein n=1 Tax=Cephalotrichum gorgonifer TaxID=2041049 RepID=A0AAE8N7F7_9PEZI|nr:uncharacterized protein DNG_08956 [Cephalotrichum gorgonifer]
MANETPETCMFFVDDSNIWVEAQKFAASGNSRMPKLEDGDQDPRLRINIGKLVDVLRKSRNQGESFLYGSRPPPNDGVWDAFKGFNFKTKIYDRAHCGKEKEVDNSMATDLSQKATELSIRAEYEPSFQRQKASTTFIAITGDRDMLPPIQRVLEYKIPVELWAWESGISTEYLRQSHRNSLLSVHFLNTIFDKISFTKFTSTHKGKSKRVDPAQTVVLCQFVNPDWGNLESFVAEELVEECRLFYTSWSETGEEIFVEFPRVKNIGVMVNKLQRRFEGVSTVVSWPEYANRFNKHSPAVVKTSNKYALLMDDDGEYPTTRGTAKGGHQPVEPNTDLRSVVKPQGANKGSETVEEKPNDNDGFETVFRRNALQEKR